MGPAPAQQSPDGSLTLSRLIVWVEQIATHGRMARAGKTLDGGSNRFIQEERKSLKSSNSIRRVDAWAMTCKIGAGVRYLS